MTWDVSKPIRVGDIVDNLLLGELAKEVDALHDGFVTATGTIPLGTFAKPINSSLDNPNGVKSVGAVSTPPYVIYSFSNGYKRKPPYLVVATIYAKRTTTNTFKAWIVRQPTYIKDVGRELTATTEYTADYETELFTYNSILSNLEGTAEPDAHLIANTNAFTGAARSHTVMRLIEDESPARFLYTNGDTLTYYNDYFHIALAPVDGSTANEIVISYASMTIIGGR